MCGIAGIVARQNQTVVGAPLSSMLDAIAHRGPDGAGMVFHEKVSLGTRRLSIVDVVHGAQPFWNEDGNVVAIVNGEIFNYGDLRTEMEARGVRLRTSCDAEIIPHLFEKYGPDFVDKLNGQFAIAIYDFAERTFYAWRDEFGICPFFYTESESMLYFASEIKALFKHPDLRPALDVEGLDQVLTFPGPVSPRTLFKGISSLPPGHRLVAKVGETLRIAKYWDFDFNPIEEDRSVESWAEELEALLIDSVKIRTAEEVPTGLYLSGGLDSSLVTALLRGSSRRTVLDSFSIDFDDPLISESRFQQIVSAAAGTTHEVVSVTPSEIWKRLERVIWHTETPLRETFNSASMALSEMARAKGYKVVLAGQGADELFAGYVGYRLDSQRQRSGGNRLTKEGEVNAVLWGDPDFSYERKYGAYADVRYQLYSRDLQQLFPDFDCTRSSPLQQPPPKNSSMLQRRTYIDCKMRLGDHLLSGHGDRMAMSNSVEIRYPFLDKRVASLSSRLPDKFKLHEMNEKRIVKKVAERWLPREIATREKFGFTAQGSPSLLGLNEPRIMDLLSDETIRRQNVFDVEQVRKLRERYSAPGFRIAVPFETDLLISVLTFGIFSDLFSIPRQ